MSKLAIASFVTVLALGPIAMAQPAEQPSAPEPGAAPNTYASLGYTVGAIPGASFSAVSLEAGYRVGKSPFWAHAMLLDGAPVDNVGSMDTTMVELRAGAEARDCSFAGVVCAFAGVDAGYATARYMDNTGRGGMRPAIAVGRVGFELGLGNVSFRPVLELGNQQVDGTVSVALRF